MLNCQSSAVDVGARAEYAIRLVQIVEVLSDDHGDGELYAQYMKQVLGGLESGTQDNRHVFEEVVERVLVYIRQGNPTNRSVLIQKMILLIAQAGFRMGCTTALLTSIPEQDIELGSTHMVIMAALACECSNITSIPPSDLLRGFADRLPFHSGNVSSNSCIQLFVLSSFRSIR
jgi:hypothetical protein